MQGEREIGGRTIKMKQGLDDLGNSQPTQMAKDAKLRRFTTRKECSQENAKVLLNFLLITLKNQKVKVFSHTNGSLNRLMV